MQEYNGATQAPSVLLALAGMAAVLVLTMAILLLSHPQPKKQATATEKRSKRDAADAAPDERSEFMRKLNDTSKICTFLCIVLCVGSLSGCGAAMQFLADGTDAVLNGLADGTNIVMNGLADGTEQILVIYLKLTTARQRTAF